MFGTVARLRVKPGHETAALAVVDAWEREYPGEGAIAGCIFRLDAGGDQYIAVTVSRDRASYEANSRDPRTDEWYRKLREHLSEDPHWEDGEVVQAYGFEDDPTRAH